MDKTTGQSVRLLASMLAMAVAGCGAVDSRQASPASPAPDRTRLEAVERGRVFVTTACSGCHATARRDPESLADGFAGGLVTSHPDMPDYVFRAGEIDDLMAWLETLGQDRPPPR